MGPFWKIQFINPPEVQSQVDMQPIYRKDSEDVKVVLALKNWKVIFLICSSYIER